MSRSRIETIQFSPIFEGTAPSSKLVAVMASITSSQLSSTFTSSHESSTISGNSEYDDFTPTAENLEAIHGCSEVFCREKALFLESARRNDKELFPQGGAPEACARVGRNLKRRGEMPQFPTNRKFDMATRSPQNDQNSEFLWSAIVSRRRLRFTTYHSRFAIGKEKFSSQR
jgi:hypothetical protein